MFKLVKKNLDIKNFFKQVEKSYDRLKKVFKKVETGSNWTIKLKMFQTGPNYFKLVPSDSN